jgi:putative peptide zinc metalloprotease protein
MNTQPYYYKLRDDLVIKERVWGDDVKYMVKDPMRLEYFTIDPMAYTLLSLADGTRDLWELTEAANRIFPDGGLDPITLRTFYENYKEHKFFEDPWQRNVLVMEMQRKDRAETLKKAFANPFEIHLPAWDPDRFFGMIVKPLGFLFTRTACWVYALIFAAATYISLANAKDFAMPIAELYTIQGRALFGVVVLWTILLLSVVLHEIGHGLTCKHYGGSVHKIGFLFLYFNPCMFCDVTEGYFFENKNDKHAVTLAGGIVDLMVAAFATFVWYFTAKDLFINEVAHRVALYNGVTGILINFNPLMKYDGYFVLSDQLDIPNLQGDSYRFVGNRLRQLVGLPYEEEPYTPRESKILGVYGALSILYVIFVLWFIFSMLSGWLIGSYRAWGYILSAGLLYMMTRKHIKKLFGFGRFVALDKATHFRRFRVPYISATAMLLLGVFLLPLPRHVRGDFTFRPAREAILRAEEPGVVDQVLVDEGDMVRGGSVLITLREDRIDLGRSRAVANRDAAMVARAHAAATGNRADAVAYSAEREAYSAKERFYRERSNRRQIAAPFDGVVMTRRPRQQIGKLCAPGEDLLLIGDPSTLHADVLVDEQVLGLMQQEAQVGLRMRGAHGREFVGRITRVAQEPSAGSVHRTYYRVVVEVDNADGTLRPGMHGIARFDAGAVPPIRHLTGWLSRILRIDFWV